MHFENTLTNDDYLRAAQIQLHLPPPTPLQLASAQHALLQAAEAFCLDDVFPTLTADPQLTPRQAVLFGLFSRMFGFVRAVTFLNNVVYQQTLTSSERSIIELWLDLELLHRNKISDGVRRFIVFDEYQKLRFAKRPVDFFQQHPELDSTPSSVEAQRAFIAERAATIEAQTDEFWPPVNGRPNRPQHWSGLGVPDRAKKLGVQEELRVVRGYDMRNFHTHSGLVGIANMDSSHFEFLCSEALTNASHCTLAALRIIRNEFQLVETLPGFDDVFAQIAESPAVALVDRILQNQGEPSRFKLHRNPPS